MRRGPAAVAVMALLTTGALSGCGDDSGAAADLPQADRQDKGPLHVDEGRYGAAGDVVECRHGPRDGRRPESDVYGGGATSDDVTAALKTARSEGLFLSLPDPRPSRREVRVRSRALDLLGGARTPRRADLPGRPGHRGRRR